MYRFCPVDGNRCFSSLARCHDPLCNTVELEIADSLEAACPVLSKGFALEQAGAVRTSLASNQSYRGCHRAATHSHTRPSHHKTSPALSLSGCGLDRDLNDANPHFSKSLAAFWTHCMTHQPIGHMFCVLKLMCSLTMSRLLSLLFLDNVPDSDDCCSAGVLSGETEDMTLYCCQSSLTCHYQIN